MVASDMYYYAVRKNFTLIYLTLFRFDFSCVRAPASTPSPFEMEAAAGSVNRGKKGHRFSEIAWRSHSKHYSVQIGHACATRAQHYESKKTTDSLPNQSNPWQLPYLHG
jgi:hypothetical protein